MSNIATRKRRLPTTALAGITGSIGEVFVDITQSTLVVSDGVTAGGVPLALKVHTHPNATTATPGFMATGDKVKLDALSLAGGIQNVLSNAVPVAAETTANFSTDFSVVDNPGASRTEFAISDSFRNQISSDTVAMIIALS